MDHSGVNEMPGSSRGNLLPITFCLGVRTPRFAATTCAEPADEGEDGREREGKREAEDKVEVSRRRRRRQQRRRWCNVLTALDYIRLLDIQQRLSTKTCITIYVEKKCTRKKKFGWFN